MQNVCLVMRDKRACHPQTPRGALEETSGVLDSGPLAHSVMVERSEYRRSAFSSDLKPGSRESTTATPMRQTLRTLTAHQSVREKETSTPKPGHGVK